MNYCPEVAVLHSALCFLNKQLKDDGRNAVKREDVCRHVRDLCGVIQEICAGLEEDNSSDQQLVWQQLIHNIILYKTVLTEYETPSGEDNGNQEEVILDKFEMTCRILPAVTKAVYFEIVKGCNWFDLFINSLRFLEPQYSSALLGDAVKHVAAGDDLDMKFNEQITDYIISQLVTCPIESSVSFHSNKYQPTAEFLSATEIDQSNGTIQMNDDGNEHRGISVMKQTVGKMLTDLLTARFKYLTNSQNSNAFNFIDWFGELCQLLFLGMLGCQWSSTNDSLSDWYRWNVYGKPNMKVAQEQNLKSLGRLSEQGGRLALQQRSLDIDNTLVEGLTNSFPWQLWSDIILVMISRFDLKNFPVENIELHRDINLVNFVSLLSTVKGSSKVPFLSVWCQGCDMIRQCKACLESYCKTDNQPESVNSNLEEILKFLTDIIEKSGNKSNKDWTLSAVKWRIDNKQPGHKEMLQRLVSYSSPEIWSNVQLLETLQRNPGVVSSAALLLQLYRLVANLYTQTNMDSNILNQLKQLVLDGFCRLPLDMQDKHLTHVYMVYKHWPVYDDQLTSHMTSILNKLTMEQSDQVMLEVSQLALQNVEAMVKGIVGRGLSSPEQAEITIQVLSRIPTVVSNSNEEVSLNQAIQEILVARQLSPREQQNLLKMVTMAVKPLSTSDNLQPVLSLLDPAEFLLKSVLPHFCLPCDIKQPMNANFALELIMGVLEALFEHSHSLDRTMKAITLDSAPWILCLVELMQECVALWNRNDQTLNKIQLKEGIEHFLALLRTLRNVSCIEFQGDEWLVSQLDRMDWTVKIKVSELIQPNNYPKTCEEFSLEIVKESGEELCMNLLRAVAVSDVMLQSAVFACMETRDITLDYHKVVLALVQLLPNLVATEWKRCLKFLQRMMDNGHFQVQFRTETHRAIPLVNLAEIEQPLSLSLLTRDVMYLLQHTTMETNLNLLAHCSRSYSGVLKDCILYQPSPCLLEGQMFLYSEVFSHVCAATWWMPLATLDAVNVILLDIMCSIESLKSLSTTQKLWKHFKGCVDCVADCLPSISSTDTKDMITKKIQDLCIESTQK